MLLASSTVIVPSLPTLSIASAMISPISPSQLAETVATWRTSSRSETFLLSRSNLTTPASTALSIPLLRYTGFAPAATFLSPSRYTLAAKTVAVVVPSPARSDVLEATSLTIWAPIFSYGSCRSISFATVTPSLVTVGEPNFLSIKTFLPLGPSVTLTASESVVTP